MSYLSLLFASKTSGMSRAVREIQNPRSKIRSEERDFSSFSQYAAGEPALPSGIASMEHWLDLNA